MVSGKNNNFYGILDALIFFDKMMLDARLPYENRASSIEHPIEVCLTTYHWTN
ncbi:MAG: hypothetical protein KAJ51_03670 [Thermoplasmata archaeon]|nr:hypothetical protein [Thermoplasmata archaeon]